MNKLINFLGKFCLYIIVCIPLAALMEYIYKHVCPTVIANNPIWFKLIFLFPIAILVWCFIDHISENYITDIGNSSKTDKSKEN